MRARPSAELPLLKIHHDNRARPNRLRLKLTDIDVTSSVNAALGRSSLNPCSKRAFLASFFYHWQIAVISTERV